jgi:hypothetical protein
MIDCASCGQSQRNPFPFCPNCGKPLLAITADRDEVVFQAGSWRRCFLVQANGRVLPQVSQVGLTGAELIVSDERRQIYTLPVVELYKQLSDRDRELLVLG